MKNLHPMTALVTGASSGIGQAIAERLARDGLTVFGTSRHPAGTSGPVRMLALDVTSDESVQAGLRTILAEMGSVDVLVNNAGFLTAGAVEEVPLPSAKAQFETNFFGAVRLIQALAPAMRERRTGRIINVTSLAGIVPLPFWGFYNASKAALESLTETLRYELSPFGVHVSAVEPGAIKTPFYTSDVKAPLSSVYAPWRKRLDCRMKEFEAAAPGPAGVAEAVSRLVRAARPPLRTTVTKEAWLFTTLKRWTPASVFETQLRGGFQLDHDRP